MTKRGRVCKHCSGLITSVRGWIERACDGCLEEVDKAIDKFLIEKFGQESRSSGGEKVTSKARGRKRAHTYYNKANGKKHRKKLRK